jgi:DNA-binding response OmpR family regulator
MPFRTRRVLVVDDYLDTAESLAVFFRDIGHDVRYAVSGHTAVQIARIFQPEIVIVDLRLPDMDGCELVERIRKNDSGKTLLIAITGQADDELNRRALDAGCEDCFLKPIDLYRLETLIECRA